MKGPILSNQLYISHPVANEIWTILHEIKQLPNEIVVKIMIQFKGLEHPIIHLLPWFENIKICPSLNIILMAPYQIRYLFKAGLDRSRKILINKLKCSLCNYGTHEWNIKDICYNDTDGIYRTWTNALLNIQKRYGSNFEYYICNKCLDCIDIFP